MLPLHALIKRILLLGVATQKADAVQATKRPSCLVALEAKCSQEHKKYDALAIEFGNLYRSAYWIVYLLSAAAVLVAAAAAVFWPDPVRNEREVLILGGIEFLLIVTIGALYLYGHKMEWQEKWLKARTCAELCFYLPLVAPLVDFKLKHPSGNWYERAFSLGHHVRKASEIDNLCAELSESASEMYAALWQDPMMIHQYGHWAIGVLRGQRCYHESVRKEARALEHRVHRIILILFMATAISVCAHFFVHIKSYSEWLSLLSIFFPALIAALHGALAQSEAFHMEQSSEQLVARLDTVISGIEAALVSEIVQSESGLVKQAVRAALAAILDEHQDWYETVSPHEIPLG